MICAILANFTALSAHADICTCVKLKQGTWSLPFFVTRVPRTQKLLSVIVVQIIQVCATASNHRTAGVVFVHLRSTVPTFDGHSCRCTRPLNARLIASTLRRKLSNPPKIHMLLLAESHAALWAIRASGAVPPGLKAFHVLACPRSAGKALLFTREN